MKKPGNHEDFLADARFERGMIQVLGIIFTGSSQSYYFEAKENESLKNLPFSPSFVMVVSPFDLHIVMAKHEPSNGVVTSSACLSV